MHRLDVWRRWRRRGWFRKQAKRGATLEELRAKLRAHAGDTIPYLEQGPRTQEELRALLEERPDGFIFVPEDPRVFGFDPEETARRVKEANAGNRIPADRAFHELRARLHARGA